MPISAKVADAMMRASWIRKMFEEGERMRLDGGGPVFDFSLGNPTLEPPARFSESLRALVDAPGTHRYMANVGHQSTREAVARYVAGEFGVPINAGNIVMTVGAGGGLNVILKAILDPGDEVIVLSPYFVEYGFYIDNHCGVMVKVPSAAGFGIDHEAVRRAISSRTRAMLVCSPNNPTGVVYTRESLGRLAGILREKGAELGSPIYLISDEPYRKVWYGEGHCPGPLDVYENTIMVTSHSKDLGLAGERIGWIAIHPGAADAGRLFAAMAFANRTLGFVNAPALMQKAIEGCLHLSVDIGWYRVRRDRLYGSLTAFGYEVVRPDGAFYIFPKAPGGDDIAFCQAMARRRVLLVPGTGFGAPGYFRISYCVEMETIDGALPEFEAGIKGA
ncbi:MAG: pyridoxal phosphate-dependent aminotransferase [Myxococcota bacterium]|jgi:aspartate aminotransferase